MSRVDGPSRARRPALRRSALAAAVVLASALWWGPGAGVAAAAPPPAAADGVAAVGCTSVGLLGVDARSGTVDQWSGGRRETPGRLGAAGRAADGVRGARLIAVDAATGVLFAVGTDGRLRYYTYDGRTGRYQGGAVVGLKWDGVTQLVAGGQGVFYAVSGTGRVLWYRVVDGRWAPGSGTAIGLDARPYSALASGGEGVLYGVRKDDKRLQRLTATAIGPAGRWAGPVDLGRTWDDAQIVGAGNGVLLGVTASGDVRWYHHTGVRSGLPTWADRSGTVVGTGFARYAALAPVDAGCGDYALPLDASVLRAAAYARPHHDYPAVDLPVPVGTAVHAIRGGKVASAGSSGRCGLGVVVRATDGGRYVYCHLSRIGVAVGSTVKTGSVLGLSGNTGHSTGPHLHVAVSSPHGTARCPQRLLVAIHDGAPVPALSALPVSGCFYASPPSPSQGLTFSAG